MLKLGKYQPQKIQSSHLKEKNQMTLARAHNRELIDLHFSSRLSIFCEYLINLAQRRKNRSGDYLFRNLEVRYAPHISKVSSPIALRSLLAAYGTQIVSIIFARSFNRN